MDTPEDYYSILLNKHFRSEYEAFFCELAMFKWGWKKLEYETCSFKNNKKVYIPDFFNPDTTTWIEIKGEWRSNGGKKKVIDMGSHVGEGRVILIGPQYYDEIRKEVLSLRWNIAHAKTY
jgi:predicted nuclease of restriction endonuclease-like RecB superfamily